MIPLHHIGRESLLYVWVVSEGDGLKVVWGDLINPDDLLRAVEGCDYVLHPAALISLAADYYPEMAKKVNVDGTKNGAPASKENNSEWGGPL